MDTTTRTVAGRYRLLERLGAGSMGTVWRAEDTALGREVAVKEVSFPPGVADDEREVLRERTRREARMAAGLDHPNAVTVYDVAEEDGTTYVVMELVPSRTLGEVVRNEGPLSPVQAAEVGLGVLGALEAAHARGIVHRDVKPGNVLMRPDGRVVLTDFGISTTTDDPSLTMTGVLVGSPAYMSPERARGKVPGPASDLWSLGATLFTVVEGRPPFDRGEALPTLSAVLTEPHAPFVAAGALGPVLDGLLTKDPADRLTAQGARAGFERVLRAPAEPVVAVQATQGVVVDRTAAVPLRRVREEAARSTDRSSKVPLVIGGIVLLGALGAGIAVLNDGGGSTTAAPLGRTPAASAAGSRAASPSPRPAAPTAASSSAPAPAPAPSATAARSAGPTAVPAGGPAPIPAGWTTYTAGQGWTLAHPPGFTVSNFQGQTQLRDPATGRTLRVDTTSSPKSDPVADWQRQSQAFAGSHSNYREIQIVKASYRAYNAADWEFTYTDGGSALHVLNRGFVVNDHRAYALYWQTRGADWTGARSLYDQIAATFQPGQ